jgi:hypothetical protein
VRYAFERRRAEETLRKSVDTYQILLAKVKDAQADDKNPGEKV